MNLQSHISLLQAPRRTVLLARRSHRPTLAARALSFLPMAVCGLFLVLTIAVVLMGAMERNRFEAFKRSMREVPVVVHLPRPSLSQESVDLAMALFSIDMESHIEWPKFDASLADRGLTAGATFDAGKLVTVGPAAFTSWGVLGSTLGHEIEIHCRQSFASILLVDRVATVVRSAKRLWSEGEALAAAQNETVIDSFGTWRAERTAYEYEIGSAERFGLTEDEVSSIHQVMDYYYPAPRPR